MINLHHHIFMARLLMLLLPLLLVTESCNRIPITGRNQLNLLPESLLMDMSLTSYKDFLKEHRVITGTEAADRVNRCGNRIARATETFLRKNGQFKRVRGFEWTFNLVDDETINAWCMPGGRVVFYTGIMPVCKNETGVAVVMGHEIAHAIARHGNERMSQQLAIQMGGIGLAIALRDKPRQTQNIFMAAYGIGSAVGIALPYSRLHESEADKMGLVFMAQAGYDPREAPKFWERMRETGGQRPPEFLSTHPSHDTRIKQLKAFMPEALKHYKARKGS